MRSLSIRRRLRSGRAHLVIEGVRRAAGSSTGAAAFGVSRTGTLGYVPGPPMGEYSSLDVALMDRSGEIQPLQLPPGPYALPRVSPQGTRVAFQIRRRQRGDRLHARTVRYEHDAAAHDRREQPVSDVGIGVACRVSVRSAGDRAVWWQPLDGPAERLTTPEQGTSHAPESWFDDMSPVQCDEGIRGVAVDAVAPRSNDGTFRRRAVVVGHRRGLFTDGRWVAYASMQRSQVTLYVQGFPTGPRYPFTTLAADTPKHPRWSRDGKELLYNPRTSGLEFVRIITTEPLTFGKPVAIPKRLQGNPPGSRSPYDLTPDGRLVGIITAGQTELVGGSDKQIQVVLNWHEELKRLVPPR